VTDIVANRYQLVAPLGGGGTSLVFRARPLAGGAEVALKLLRPQFAVDPSLRRRFAREAELARGLAHACIVRVLDAGEHDGTPFLTMELMDGETLRQRLERERRLPLAAARSICIALAGALQHAHERGIIHRDLKPENVFVSGWTVKLGDFGNARVVSLASVTGASLTWGTPEYVAPEQFLRGRADPRSDLYTLGVVTYEMLTGRLPWSRAEALRRLERPTAPPVSPTGAGPELDRVIADLLAPEPGARPASGAEVIERVTEPAGTGALSRARCGACGALRPDDVPRCLACGEVALQAQHTPGGRWRVILDRLPDDAGATAKLLRVLDPLVTPLDEPVTFQTQDPELEGDRGHRLPAVLFAELDEQSAKEIAVRCGRDGLDVRAREGTAMLKVAGKQMQARPRLFASLALGLLAFRGLTFFGLDGVTAAAAAGAAAVVLNLLVAQIHGAEAADQLDRQIGIFRLRPQLAAVPGADALLDAATESVAGIRAPELRALASEVAGEIYRVTRRVAALPARNESAPAARIVDAARPLLERVGQLAARLDALDDALAGASEGELMQRRDRLDRAAKAAGADRDALAIARTDIERTLERRAVTEQERARLSSKLCALLGTLRLIYRKSTSVLAPAEDEAAALAAATRDLDALLASFS
jgi:hypothetical protein